MKISSIHSPNFDKKKRSNKSIKLLVIHYTGMQSERESIRRLCNPKSKVSSHYIITQNGNVHRLVQHNRVAWHAGKSCWGKYKGLNKNSIGIELVNRGHEFGYTNFKGEQISSLIKICKVLIKKYKIKKKNIVGHSDIAPLRKMDPGEKFPWKKLAKKGIGIWHNCNHKLLINNRNINNIKKRETIKFIKNLNKIGYCVTLKNKSILIKILKSFQRHYRNELVNGLVDKECLIIAKYLLKNS